MRRFLWIPLCFSVLLVPAVVLAGSGGSFNGVVDSIQSRYHVRATHIPFLGLACFIARKSTHDSVANLHVAEFENVGADVDGAELNDMVAEKLGPEWERIVRETSRRGNETLIYMRPEGARMGLFVVDKDGSELNVVQVSVDPDHLDDDIGHYRHHRDRSDNRSNDDSD
jgi:hypothetical protein